MNIRFEDWLERLSEEEYDDYIEEYDGDLRKAYDEEMATIAEDLYDSRKDDMVAEELERKHWRANGEF